jgi:hypothetical protein
MSTHVLTPSSSAHQFWGANRQTSSHFVLRRKQRNRHGDFVGRITKLQLPVLRPKLGNLSERFWGQTTRTIATDFEAKQGETIGLGFEAEPRYPCTSSPCARFRPHTASPNLSIIRESSTRSVLDHSRSSAPSVLLLPRSSSLPTKPHQSPIHPETSKHISPLKTDSRVKPPKFHGFKFKARQVNYSSKSKWRTT